MYVFTHNFYYKHFYVVKSPSERNTSLWHSKAFGGKNYLQILRDITGLEGGIVANVLAQGSS